MRSLPRLAGLVLLVSLWGVSCRSSGSDQSSQAPATYIENKGSDTIVNLALAWASIGEANRAFDQLERESFQIYWAPHAVWWDPRFDSIRDDARFARVEDRAARAWSPEWK